MNPSKANKMVRLFVVIAFILSTIQVNMPIGSVIASATEDNNSSLIPSRPQDRTMPAASPNGEGPQTNNANIMQELEESEHTATQTSADTTTDTTSDTSTQTSSNTETITTTETTTDTTSDTTTQTDTDTTTESQTITTTETTTDTTTQTDTDTYVWYEVFRDGPHNWIKRYYENGEVREERVWLDDNFEQPITTTETATDTTSDTTTQTDTNTNTGSQTDTDTDTYSYTSTSTDTGTDIRVDPGGRIYELVRDGPDNWIKRYYKDGKLQEEVWVDNNFKETGMVKIYNYNVFNSPDREFPDEVLVETWVNGHLVHDEYTLQKNMQPTVTDYRAYYALPGSAGDDLPVNFVDSMGYRRTWDYYYDPVIQGGGWSPWKPTNEHFYAPGGNEISQEQYYKR